MTRVNPLDVSFMTPDQRNVYNAISNGPRGGVRGPLAVWLHRPELAQTAQAFGAYCRYETLLSPKLSELAILTVARFWSSEYEWYAHKPIALEAGVAEATLEAIRCHSLPAFEHSDERAVHAFVSALQSLKHVPESLYRETVDVLGQGAVIDLVGLVGYYTLISMTLNTFEINPPSEHKRELE
ncbi:carboxymuconolactone decarboxylase family protein [Pseudomonas sp. GD03842]|uniref:carboxymuconolactone decarboxylase family protein n=1 Tax=Pseudomonas sp. GD03842 TaxID=2975385 RepID=UPI002448F831|nr:carboxymuconolactone decarboxylase family protein [Pseudomonas sp. GD03842]MDH0745136.1 carboxymuconolactone decarboxylase family protein [Pseudomonas sp. GD03842]